MCLDLTGSGKAQTWIQREISSSSTLCEENDQTLVKVKRDRPSTALERGLSGFVCGMGQLCCVYCLVPNSPD